MNHSTTLDSLFACELESERCKLISEFGTKNVEEAGLAFWTILSMSPSRLEKVNVATSIKLSQSPNALWTVCSYLLGDSEQDVVGNAINAMTHSRVRSFAHRAFHYLRSPERPQRVLYCLARYCEEAHDGRIASQLAPTLASDLSDAFLARTFNALYTHGIKSEAALQVARELVSSHIDATNMDRKAAVSAITYLFFAGNQEVIEELRKIYTAVSIPELRRLLNWGLREIESLGLKGNSNSTKDAAQKFWIENFSDREPNFTGYGCFSDSELLSALQELDTIGQLSNVETVTMTILKTGNRACIEWLSNHQNLGVHSQLDNQQTLTYWKLYCPTDISGMNNVLINPEEAERWFSDSPELLVLHINESMMLNIVEKKNDWLLGMFLAIERLLTAPTGKVETFNSFLDEVLNELKTLLTQKAIRNTATNATLSCLIGTTLRSANVEQFRLDLISDSYWTHLALANCHQSGQRTAQKSLDNFEKIAQRMSSEALSDENVLSLSRTTALAVLCSQVSIDELLARKIMSFESYLCILDPNNNVEGLGSDRNDDSSEVEESESSATDWAGHTVVDRPVARWGTILIALKLNELSQWVSIDSTKKIEIESRLKEAMRTARHVEKRWIVRALANLGTDDAIKTLLYQGLQHIDSEFVSHVIRELLPSPHPRAQQALIRCIGRNAIQDDLKLNILEDISIHNPEEILQELRTLEILRLPTHIDDAVRDAVGRIASLLDEKESSRSTSMGTNVVDISGQDVDATIRNQMSMSESLNVDARSALRTAEMILLQSRGWTQSGMDLSPIVNMHFKAVELVLRDTFEPFTDALLRRGQISRKLDLLGYARPIPEKMQIFEDYLANLPVVKTIPYFSKFKLRKMLRGVCLYRPGKRFTLDGPKAFALFFLVTSRLKCNFGLEKMLPLGFATDVELFEYIKLIHSLQDSRNRAVHEGLTWEAKDEIESMRAQAFKVIELTLKIKKRATLLHEALAKSNSNGIGLGA
jgi:hypothetical protein